MEQVSRETEGNGFQPQEEGTGRGEGCFPHPDRRKEAPEGQWTEDRGGGWSLSLLTVQRQGQLLEKDVGKHRWGIFEEKGGEWSIREGA